MKKPLSLAFLASLLAPAIAHAQGAAPLAGSSASAADNGIALGALVIGVVLGAFYLRGMYLVMHYASLTYDVDLSGSDAREPADNARGRNLLLVGAALLVVLSALIISSYGWGWGFLYVGPALSLLGPIVIIVSMELDIRRYRRALRDAAPQPVPGRFFLSKTSI